MDKRFIEESFPVKEVSTESAKEKNIRHGHISTLHIWWARRPLASCRATAYAALIPAARNAEDWNETRNFIIELCKWENTLNQNLIESARKEILDANCGKPPKVLDCFAGGGAIPLEALRLGCETYASDYNPVAVLLEKCTLEYPQKYGEKLEKNVKKWAEWVLEETKKEIGKFYPTDKEEKKGYFANSTEESIPMGYIWARTIHCQNPSCEAEIPLMRQFWLAKKENRKIALKPLIKNGKVEFEIVGQEIPFPKDFKPEKGTISKAIATCLVCGGVIDAKSVRKQFQEGKAGQRMIAVVVHDPKKQGRFYRITTEKDLEVYNEAEKYLEEKRAELIKEWGFDPIPDEPTPEGKGRGAERAFSIRNYALNMWGDLFNARQKLALIIFVEKVRFAYKKMLNERNEEEFMRAVISYLALGVDELTRFNSVLNPWKVDAEAIVHIFGRQTLTMLWDYDENNPLGDHGGTWTNRIKEMMAVFENLSKSSKVQSTVTQSSATLLPYPNDYFDAVFTDPPYYDNVPYSYLSDFFYVWLKRTIGDLYPDLFLPLLTRKSEEIVAYTHEKTWEEAKRHFETMLGKSFQEIYRVLKPNGIGIIVYAHKTTAGWETVINALLNSGLTVSASWPISTEMEARLRARESAALASSIYIVVRKIQKQEFGFYPELKKELKNYLNEKLERLWLEGVSGADFFIASIGAGIEIFGKYEKIIDYENNVIKADIILEEIRKLSTDFAINRILQEKNVTKISPMTRFYVLWRWNYLEAKVKFDEARKLAQGVGINLEKEWNKGFIRKEKEFIRVLGPKERKIQDLEDSEELIDVLHQILLLWEKDEDNEILRRLGSTYGTNEAFYRVAQAISQTLPNESKEKKLLDGFLSGKERLKEKIKTSKPQTTLERWNT